MKNGIYCDSLYYYINEKILLGYITNILMEAITEIRFNPITQFVHTNLSNSHFLCDK